MKILLTAINSKYIHSNPALYDLKACALKTLNNCKGSVPDFEGLDIEIAEYTINNLKESVLSDIFKKRPDVIALSCYIWNISFIKNLLPDLHKVLPEIPIWLGGPEVSYHPEEAIAFFPYIKGVMVGEGEETFRELCLWYVKNAALSEEHFCCGPSTAKLSCCETSAETDANNFGNICNNISLRNIQGLCINENGVPHFTEPRPLLHLDSIPFPYEDLSVFENRIIYYESSRGCPFACTYCLSAADKKNRSLSNEACGIRKVPSGVRYRSIDPVKKELQFFLDHKVPQVKFIDRTFNCSASRALEIWKYIHSNDNGITNFHFEIAADLITDEEIEILSRMRPGLVQLEIGVQSTNNEALSAVHRRTDPDRIREVVRRIKHAQNVHVHLDLIAGLPFEDFQSFKKSFNDVYSMKPDQLQLGFLKVLKGSPMEADAAKYEIIYSAEAPYEVLSTRWIDYGELLILKGIENMTDTFYNSMQFTRTLPVLISRFDSAFDLFHALSDFYETRGYSVNTPSRMARYNILLEFAAENDPENLALYKELLTFDAYARENLKSRPAFAADLSQYHDLLPKAPRNALLHREVFWYPVWEEFSIEDATPVGDGAPIIGGIPVIGGRTFSKLPAPVVLEFDYTRKDPLSGNVKASII